MTSFVWPLLCAVTGGLMGLVSAKAGTPVIPVVAVGMTISIGLAIRQGAEIIAVAIRSKE